MAYTLKDKVSSGAKKVSSAVVNTPGVKPPSTIEKSSVRTLPRLPEKFPATVVHPPKDGTASGGAKVSSGGGTGASSGGSGSYGGSGSSAASSSAAPARAELPRFDAPAEDEAARLRYESALAALEQKRGEAPTYESQYDEQIRSLYDQITGRAPFRYDSATDPLYQQYAQRYTEQGAEAMRDTMGRAAALTGGYGSSYAQSVGQQQYDAYLRRLADVLPQTYGMALHAYEAEGDELTRRYELIAAREKSEYERYLDSLGQYNRELALARSDVDDAREELRYGDETAYRRAVDDYNRRMAEDKLDYSREQDAYDRLVRLIAAGYSPSAAEYAQAGMSPAQGAALMAQATAPGSPTVIIRREKEGGKSSSSKRSSSNISSSKGVKKTQGSLKK